MVYANTTSSFSFDWLVCLVLFCFVEVELSGREERARRNSDSVLYPSVKEELSMLKMKRIQAAFNQRIAFMEKEIEEVSERYVYPSSSPLKTD